MATKENDKDGKVVKGTSKADKITNRGSNVEIIGGAGNDCIKGGSGRSTLWGGADNDSLCGGSGKDTFVYKSGEDTDRIFDYASGDMLKIFKEDGSKGSFTKSSFSGGDLTLTINGGGKVIFDGVSSGDKFNINGKTYTISGTKLVK